MNIKDNSRIVLHSLISNIYIPIFLYLMYFTILFFANDNNANLRLFLVVLIPILAIILIFYWRTSVLIVTEKTFTVKYPFKIPFKRSYIFRFDEISHICFQDALYTQGLARIIFYYKDTSKKEVILPHDIGYKKIQVLINELRKRNITIKVKSTRLK